MEYSGAGGKLIHEKNQKQKILWHCPFNQSQPKHPQAPSHTFRIIIHNSILKVPKCEIFPLFDFNDFYVIKSL